MSTKFQYSNLESRQSLSPLLLNIVIINIIIIHTIIIFIFSIIIIHDIVGFTTKIPYYVFYSVASLIIYHLLHVFASIRFFFVLIYRIRFFCMLLPNFLREGIHWTHLDLPQIVM